MNQTRTQYWQSSLPKTISKQDFIGLVNELDDFMSGLATQDRKIKCKALGSGSETYLEGKDSWKVFEPYPFEKLEHLECELLLVKNDNSSCELHIEFRKNHIFLSVSDIGTGWGEAVFQQASRELKRKKIFTNDIIRKLYSAILRLQNIFIILGAIIIFVWNNTGLITYLVSGTSFLIAGIAPALTDIYRIFSPSKPITLLEDTVPKRSISGEKLTIAISLLVAVLGLIKEIIGLLH